MRINRLFISLISIIIFININVIAPARLHKRDTFSFLISEGTKWCGLGNIAKNCDDLGEYADTDNCCREHDACPYTFASNLHKQFNGYTSHYFNTISHCECDVIFHDCLNEKPYKHHSYEIWESYDSLDVKCFSYMPCSDDINEHKNIWDNIEKRDSGECINGTRILVFASIGDYEDFVSNLNLIQKIEINKRLITDQDRFTPENKINYTCYHSFPNFKDKIAKSFEMEFLNGLSDYDNIKGKFIQNNKVEMFDKMVEYIKSPDYVKSLSTPMHTNENDTKIKHEPQSESELKRETKTIFWYNLIIPIGIILVIFVFLKFLINVYDKDNF